jgi:hypothetical protein
MTIAFAFPGEPELARRGLAHMGDYHTFLLSVLRNARDAERFAERMGEWAIGTAAAFAPTLVDRLGPAAAQTLGTLMARATTEPVRKRLAQCLALIESPAVAAALAQVRTSKAVRAVADEWFARCPDLRAAAPAGAVVAREGAGATLLPPYWDPATLARPVSPSGTAFTDARMDELGRALCGAPLDHPASPLFVRRDEATPESLDAFACSLLARWEKADLRSIDEGPLLAVAFLGGPDAETQLIESLPRWLSRPRKRWVELGYRVLARRSTTPALAFLDRAARTVIEDWAWELAETLLAGITEKAGIAIHERMDELVPRFGLDEQRRRGLAYSGVEVRVGFGEDGKPLVLDREGRPLKRLPRPDAGATEEYARAQREWKAMRDGVARVIREESAHLEQAMCAGLSWPLPRLRSLVAHPLLGRLARAVVWTTTAEPATTFRIAEDGSFADVADVHVAFPDETRVALPHPLALAPAALAAWRQVFSDYQILQPFEQLTRAVYVATPEEAASHRVTHVAGRSSSERRRYAMRHRRWTESESDLRKRVVTTDGHRCFVVLQGALSGRMEGLAILRDVPDTHVRVDFGALPPIVFSEVVRDAFAAVERD